jgi:hypothetical protein
MRNERDAFHSTLYHRAIRKRIGEVLSARYEPVTVSTRQVTHDPRSTRRTDACSPVIPFPYQIDFAMYGNDAMDLTSAGLRSM